MGKMLEKLYNDIQESELIKKSRQPSAKTIHKTVEKFMGNESIDQEEITGNLYNIYTEAEKNGFTIGFLYAINLIEECNLAVDELI